MLCIHSSWRRRFTSQSIFRPAILATQGCNRCNPMCQVAASITYQSLFRRFNKLSAMSGTALTEAEELATFYGLRVLQVPPVLRVQVVC